MPHARKWLCGGLIERLETRRFLTIGPIDPVQAVPFTRVLVDSTPSNLPLEKTLMDVDGDGRLDAVVGYNDGSGIAWYRQPSSGPLTGNWTEDRIVTTGTCYEDVVPLDVNHDGAMDFVISYDDDIKWFENPRGSGGNPATDPWPIHTIGAFGCHDMLLGDLDGDGKTDVITNNHIYFQNGPDSWTTVGGPNYNRSGDGLALLDTGFGKIDIVGTGDTTAPYSMRWYENPRDHGGNARTDTWISRTFGQLFDPTFARGGMCYETLDVNNDGRMDIVTAQGERPGDAGPPPVEGISWFAAPVDPRNGTWIKHSIDTGITDVHKLRIADINGDGRQEIVFAEQEQSDQDRVGLLFNWDGAGNDWKMQVLSTGSGHNQWVADVDNDGDLDILNAAHGFFGHAHPIELYVNQQVRPAVVGSSFAFNTAPQTVQFTFNTNVSASLGTNDLTLLNLTTNATVPTGSIALSYDPGTNTAKFTFPGYPNGTLPDGDYRATLNAAGVTNPSGTPMASNYSFTFFFLQGDANHDRRVNVLDFAILATNFGRTGGADFAHADFNYDGRVNVNDFAILASRFGDILA